MEFLKNNKDGWQITSCRPLVKDKKLKNFCTFSCGECFFSGKLIHIFCGYKKEPKTQSMKLPGGTFLLLGKEKEL